MHKDLIFWIYLCLMYWDFELKDISQVALQVKDYLSHSKVLAFHGEMGAGKTTFIAALCKVLGVSSVVASPTFALIYEYNSASGPVYHMDLYRLNSEEDAIRAGVEDALWSGAPCLVEWPERAPGLLPPGTLHLTISTLEGDKRRLHLSGN